MAIRSRIALWVSMMLGATAPALAVVQQSRSAVLREVTDFGNNPGNLRMFVREPANASQFEGKRPMVLLLHGCGQDAAGILRLSGWGAIADSTGTYLVLAEQKGSNNPWRCFNWYRGADTQRGRGEVASIARIIEHALAHYPIDKERVSAYGVSAGGAMVVAVMACYPQHIANAAVLAGTPYGGVLKGEAERRPIVHPNALLPEEWAARVFAARLDPASREPRLVVMHGTRDPVADFELARALVAQWTAITGTDSIPDTDERIDATSEIRRFGYRDSMGREPVVLYRIKDLGHRLAQDDEGSGWLGKDVGFNSTRAIAREFGLLP